ncbi:MAG: hypothetical protein ABJB47_06470 [Actinomycetota bacterium]
MAAAPDRGEDVKCPLSDEVRVRRISSYSRRQETVPWISLIARALVARSAVIWNAQVASVEFSVLQLSVSPSDWRTVMLRSPLAGRDVIV